MNTDLIYTIIIVGGALLWPVIKLATQSVYTLFEQRLPANVQALLEQYAAMAVCSVEQEARSLSDFSSEQKKSAAWLRIEKMFVAAKLPVPDTAIMNAAIEAAVLMLNQQPETPQPVLPPKSIMAPIPPQKS